MNINLFDVDNIMSNYLVIYILIIIIMIASIYLINILTCP